MDNLLWNEGSRRERIIELLLLLSRSSLVLECKNKKMLISLERRTLLNWLNQNGQILNTKKCYTEQCYLLLITICFSVDAKVMQNVCIKLRQSGVTNQIRTSDSQSDLFFIVPFTANSKFILTSPFNWLRNMISHL